MPSADDSALKPWELLDTEVVLETPWFKIHRQHMRTASGVDATYYVHDASDGVICVCVTRDGQIIVEQQYRPPVKKISFDYPAGFMEPDETKPEESIRRELSEELGFMAHSIKELAVVDSNPGFSKTRLHIFLAHGAIEQPSKQEKTESIVPLLVNPAEILEMINEGKIACTFCVSATFFAFQELGLLTTPKQ